MLKKLLLSLPLICALGVATQPAAARPHAAVPGIWRVETIDRAPGDENDPGILRYPALAIDSSGVTQVVYSKGLEQNPSNPLVYARKNGPTWITQTLEASGEKPSLVLSSQQQPRVAFFDFASDETLIFRNLDIAGGFRSVVTTTIGSNQATADLALSTTGEPLIAFTQKAEGSNFNLLLATFSSGNWALEPVAEDVGGITSLALDLANQVHLSYQDALSRTVKYAARTPTGWQTETVGNPDTLNLAIPNSIAVDATATPHIVYVKFSTPPALIYARRTNTGWVTETIAANANLAFSFALDQDGNPHVAYIEPGAPAKPTYAVRTNSSWITSTVSNDDIVYISLALDPSGQPTIAYTNFDTGNLKLARLYRGLAYLPLVRKP